MRLTGAFGDKYFVSRRLKASVVFVNETTHDSLSASTTFLVSDALGEGKALIGLPLLSSLGATVSLAGRRPVLTLRGEKGRKLRVRLCEVDAPASIRSVSPGDPTAWSWGDKADDGLKRTVLGAAEAYPSLFAEGAAPPKTPLVEASVKLKPDAAPVFRRPYAMSATYRAFLKAKIAELEAAGVVERISGCAWASPAFLVPKPGGDPTLEKDMRLVVDLTAVNKAAVWEPQPTPDMRDITTLLDGKAVFSRLDLKSAYFSIGVDDASARTLAISTHEGVFAFKRLPMGFSNSAFFLQELVVRALGELLNSVVYAYADDLLIASSSESEHVEHVRDVLARLAKANVRLSTSKCEFGASTIDFLGHVLRPQEIGMQQAKIQKLLDMRAPATRTELRSFYGLASYYRSFIRDLGRNTTELHRLMRDGEAFKWTNKAESEFRWLKAAIADGPTLRIPSPEGRLVLETDSSLEAAGWILSQEVPGSTIRRPILFGSERYKGAEKNLAAIEAEALAIVKAVRACTPYIAGQVFHLVTDQKPLTFILDSRLDNAMKESKVARWKTLLQGFRFTTEYRRGEDNNADCLSRLTDPAGPEPPRASGIEAIESAVFDASVVQSNDPVDLEPPAPVGRVGGESPAPAAGGVAGLSGGQRPSASRPSPRPTFSHTSPPSRHCAGFATRASTGQACLLTSTTLWTPAGRASCTAGPRGSAYRCRCFT
jgi:hypothetical protein